MCTYSTSSLGQKVIKSLGRKDMVLTEELMTQCEGDTFPGMNG